MKANPGGNLAPEGVYGRDQLINLLWERLENQSILMDAERRIGKTQVLRKMLMQPKSGWKPIYRNVEKVHSAQEFAELVYDDVQQFLGTAKRAASFIRRFFEENENDYVNLKSRSWKKLLTSAVEDLMASKSTERLVFFWDELPWMVQSIQRNEGSKSAVEVLDTIRSLRHEQPEFRVIFTGSIGLHHVLGKLSADGYPTSAKNDMFHVTVTPLTPCDAERLAADLLQGEKITCDNLADAASTIAEEVDYFPFYIHHIVAGLRIEQSTATETNIKAFVSRQLVDASDPWQLAHYRNRLSTYYPDGDDARNVAIILDVLTINPDPADPLSVDEIFKYVTDRGSRLKDRDDLLRLLRLMDADQYLSRETEGGYRFRFPLIRRWWKLDRGL
ncbi:MAG: hypothetical protein ACK5YR_06000 [Pirellula sp.]|jgi:hypothetical protein